MNLLDLLFPKRCVSCGAVGSYFCPPCLSQIKFIEINLCPVCERPAIFGAAHPKCQSKYSLDGLTSVCAYEGPIKAAVHRLKYRPWVTDLGEKLVEMMVKQTNFDFLQDKKEWLVVPVPLHSSRKRERGFNQSEILGRLLAKNLDLGFCPEFLVRRKKTKPQADLKGRERQENIKDAFAINPNSRFMIHNLKILLVDDVWTTGATLRTCGSVLKKVGFAKVWALTLAR